MRRVTLTNSCPLHDPGDPLCHYPRPAGWRVRVVAYRPSVWQQLLALKWEIAFFTTVLGAFVGYLQLGR